MNKIGFAPLLLGLVLLWSCQISTGEQEVDDEDDSVEMSAEQVLKELKQGDFEIVVIEGCQYLMYTEDFTSTQQGYGFMAHKGNCNNPIHCYNPIEPDSVEN